MFKVFNYYLGLDLSPDMELFGYSESLLIKISLPASSSDTLDVNRYIEQLGLEEHIGNRELFGGLNDGDFPELKTSYSQDGVAEFKECNTKIETLIRQNNHLIVKFVN